MDSEASSLNPGLATLFLAMDCFLPVIYASDCVVFRQTEKKKKENKCSTTIKVSIKFK